MVRPEGGNPRRHLHSSGRTRFPALQGSELREDGLEGWCFSQKGRRLIYDQVPLPKQVPSPGPSLKAPHPGGATLGVTLCCYHLEMLNATTRNPCSQAAQGPVHLWPILSTPGRLGKEHTRPAGPVSPTPRATSLPCRETLGLGTQKSDC